MNDFLDVAGDLLNSGKVDEKRHHFERVFKAISQLQVVHSKAQLDLYNIESIFTVLELGKVIQKVPGHANNDEIDKTIASLKEVIVKTLEQSMLFPIQNGGLLPPEPYQEFAKLIHYLTTEVNPRQTVSIITFNYDVAADLALANSGMGPNYGITDSSVSEGERSRHVDLLKLHGSLNWAVETIFNKIHPFDINSYLNIMNSVFHQSGRSSITVDIGSILESYFARRASPPICVAPEPLIVPPSWNKSDYHHALSNIWKKAADHLGSASSIFVIGFSLPETDAFFRHLFALGCEGATMLRRIRIFNPDKTGTVDSRFRSLLGTAAISRYEYEPRTFEEAIDIIKRDFAGR
jgi:hypothetical protein